jgi:SRSO17 transposase
MTTADVRAAALQLVQFHEAFAPLFGRPEAQDLAYSYLHGLLTCPGRKSVEPIALAVGHGKVSGLQKFINRAPWQPDELQAEAQAVFAERLVPSADRWPIGTVGVLDETSFTKRGRHSAGVARQHCGRLGKTENCQVGVFLIGVTPAGSALLDHRLYLHQDWFDPADGAARRERAHIPDDVAFRTKPQIAAELVRAVAVNDQVQLDWIVADQVYGQNGALLDELEELGLRYLMAVPVGTTVWTADPAASVPAYSGFGRPPVVPTREAVRTVVQVAEALPAAAWRALAIRPGATGPLTFQFARARVWAVRHRKPGPPVWPLIRRSLEAEPKVTYYVSNAPAEEPLESMALVSGCRWRVEEFFEEAKGYLGMAQYETRSWAGWHHHMSLVGLAHLFVTLTRQRLGKKRRA